MMTQEEKDRWFSEIESVELSPIAGGTPSVIIMRRRNGRKIRYRVIYPDHAETYAYTTGSERQYVGTERLELLRKAAFLKYWPKLRA